MHSHEIQWNSNEHEWFSFVTRTWNVQKAKTILKNKSYESIEVDIETFAKLLSKEKETANGKMLVLGVGVDNERLDTKEIDLNIPIIIVSDPVIEYMVIDGWHRIAKAQKLGIKTLNGFLLDKSDSRKVFIK